MHTTTRTRAGRVPRSRQRAGGPDRQARLLGVDRTAKMASAAGLLANAATVTGGNGSPSGPVGDQAARSHRTDGAGICPGDRLCRPFTIGAPRPAARPAPRPVPAEPAQVRAGGPDGGGERILVMPARSGSLRRSCSRIWSGRPSWREARIRSGSGRCWTGSTMRWRRRSAGRGDGREVRWRCGDGGLRGAGGA